ncbi:MAG: hypothetical protein Fur0036_13750 [Fimbriimonadaceae bacterium]
MNESNASPASIVSEGATLEYVANGQENRVTTTPGEPKGQAKVARKSPKLAKPAEKSDDLSVYYGSGNVFADLGLENPEELLAKARMASLIHDIIEARELTQAQAAELMGIDQPKVSKIIRGRLSEFSIEWLMARVLALGLDVEIVIHTSTPKADTGTIRVSCQ